MVNEVRNTQRFRLAIWIAYWSALFVGTHLPPVGIGVPGRHIDKLFHAVMYAVLTVLAGRWNATRQASRRQSLVVWALIFVAYAGIDEWLQRFVGRTPSVGDLIADGVGVLAATVYLSLRRTPAARVSPSNSISK